MIYCWPKGHYYHKGRDDSADVANNLKVDHFGIRDRRNWERLSNLHHEYDVFVGNMA